jgi:filamentous hemagglutinin family protein
MNSKLYKVIFSKRLNALVVVGENCVCTGKSISETRGSESSSALSLIFTRFIGALCLGFVLASTAFADPAANALPVGGEVAQGAATISQAANTMDINQATSKAVVNWQSFDIGAAATVNVIQPSNTSVLLSRVLGNNPSQIFGSLNANGQVILINPNGILFGKDGSVNANAFTASTLDMRDADFMAGNYRYFSTGVKGEIVNQGGIKAQQYVALIGAKVVNDGVLNTSGGNVYLGAADAITVPVSNSGRIKMELSPASINTAVENTQNGVIVTQGGQVYIQASSLNDAVASIASAGNIDTSGKQAGGVNLLADAGIVKVSGIITANSTDFANKGGDIIVGRDLRTGKLAKATDVSSATLESKKGFVETSGDFLATNGTKVFASEWLLDPYNITIAASGATGTAYASNFTSGADSIILASDISANLTAGTSVTLATGVTGASAGNIAVNESIAKTGGSDATLTLQAHGNIDVAAGKTITSNTGKLNVVFNSDSDGANGGGITFGTGAGIISNGGNITLGGGTALNGTGFATADGSSTLQGVALYSATINAGGGNIVMNGLSPTTSATNVVGIFMGGGAITTTGAGQITLTGKNQLSGTTGATGAGFSMSSGTITGGSTGALAIEGNSSTSSASSINNKGAIINGTVTSTGGHISVTGTGGAGARFSNGVDIGGSVLGVGSANINITGTAASSSNGGNVGVTTSGTATISSVNGNINITGTGGTGNGDTIRNHGVSVGSSNAIQSTGSGNVTVTGRAINSDTNFSQGVVIGGAGLRANSGNIRVDGQTLQNYQVAVNVSAAVTATTGNVYIRSVNAGISNSSAGVISGNNVSIENTAGTIDANGVITPGAGGATTWAGQVARNGIDLNGSVTAANNLNIYGNQTNTEVGVRMSGATTTISGKNVTLYGKSSTGNGVLLSGVTLSGQYINAIGAATSTSTTARQGFVWNGGNINTTGSAGTSTASVVKGTSAASGNTSGYGAFMMIANSATNAASGTSLTFAGEATNLAAGVNTNERGILVQGGYTLAATGDITLDGSSKSSEGIAFGGTINMGTVAGVTNKLTIKGTAAASSNNSWNAINFSGAINGNAAISSINFWGDAKNLSGANKDNGVNISGVITGSAANVNIQSTGATILTSAAITGANISIDNSNGTINSSTGAITAGAATAGSVNGMTIGGNVTATGNLNLLGVTTSATGINLAASKSLSGATVQATGNTGGIYGLDLAAGSSVITTGSSGASVLTGNGASTSGSGNAVVMLRGNTLTAASGSTLSVAGNATTNTTANYLNTRGLRVEGDITTNGAVTLSGTSKSADGLIVQNGSINVNTGSLALNGVVNANGSGGGSTGAVINKAITLNNGTSLAITGNAVNQGTATAAETGVSITAAIGQASGQTTAGNISIAGSSGSVANSNGVIISATGTIATGAGNITIVGQRPVGGMGVGVSTAASVTSTSGNVTLQSIGGTVTQSAGTISGANITIDNTGAGLTSLIADNTGGQPTLAIGTALGGSINPTTGAITAGSRLNVNGGGVSVSGALSTPGNINILGNVATTTNSGVSLATTGSATTSGISSIIKIQSNGNVVAGGSIGNTGTSGVTSSINLTSTSGSVSGSGTLTSNGVTASGGGMTINTALAGNISGAISGTGSLTKTGAGSTVLTAANSYSGTTTVSTGVLQIGDGGTSGTLGTGAVIDNASLVFNRSNTMTVVNAISGTGSLMQSGTGTTILTSDNSYIGTTTITGGTLQVGNGGTAGTLGVGNASLSNNANLNYLRSAATTIANDISGTGNVSAIITGAISHLTVDHTIALTDGTVNLVTDANLLLSSAISTTNVTSSAIFLEAGKVASAGTLAGGDVQISGGGALNVGAGGRATVMTGSIAGSTGLTALVGTGSGNFRYNSDELVNNYTTALGAGTYAIYRESPTATITINNDSKTYNGIAYTGSNGYTLTSGGMNGDAASQVGAGISYGGTSQNAKAAGSYTITGPSAASALGYHITYVGGTLTVNKADFSVALTGTVEKVYDGLTTAHNIASANYSILGMVSGEGLSVTQTAGSYTSKYVSANVGAGGVAAQLASANFTANTGTDLNNYNLPTIATGGVGKITPAPLTVKANDSATFVTLDPNGATNNGFTFTGFVNGEPEGNALSGSVTRTYTGSANPVAGIYTGVYGVDITGLTAASGNYSISASTTKGNLVVVPAGKLLVDVAGNTKIYGDLTSSSAGASSNGVTASYYTTDNGGFISNLVVTNLGSGAWKATDITGAYVTFNTLIDSTNRLSTGGYLNVGSYTYGASPFVVTGTTNFNDSFTNGGVLTVNAKAINLNTTGLTKVYDGNTNFTNVTLGTDKLTGDLVTATATTGTFANKNTGSQSVTFSGISLAGTDSTNYSVQSTPLNDTATITAKAVTLTAGAVTKTYDGGTTYIISSTDLASLGAQLGVVADSVSASTIAYTDPNAGVGNKSVTLSGVSVSDGNSGNNYVVTLAGNSTSTINKASAVVTANSDLTKIYNGQNQTLSGFTAAGLVNGETESVLTSVTAGVAGKNAGTFTATAGGNDSNYNLSFVNGSLVIAKANATVKANSDLTRVYNGQNQTLSGFTATGLVNGETESLLTGVTAGVAGKNAGTYISTAIGSDTNYNLQFVNGSLIINQADLQLQANGVTKVYDGTTTLAGIALTPTGILSNDDVSAVANAGNFISKDAATGIGFTLSGLTLSGAASSNYRLASPTLSGSGSITPKALSLAGSLAQDKVYDGSTQAVVQAGTVIGLVGTETLALASTANFSDATAGNNKTVLAAYTLRDGANGGLATNYSLANETLAASITSRTPLAKPDALSPLINPVSPQPSISPSQSGGSSSRIGNPQLTAEVVKPEVVYKQCSVENPETCECQNTLVEGVSLCMAPSNDANANESETTNLKLSKQ